MYEWNDKHTSLVIGTYQNNVVYPDLSYQLTGVLFQVHNQLGRHCRERQYADMLEVYLRENNFTVEREKELPIQQIENKFTNIVDFAINDLILLDVKAKQIVTKEDYHQINRYLEAGGYKLGLIVNFRNRYLKPIRVIRTNS